MQPAPVHRPRFHAASCGTALPTPEQACALTGKPCVLEEYGRALGASEGKAGAIAGALPAHLSMEPAAFLRSAGFVLGLCDSHCFSIHRHTQPILQASDPDCGGEDKKLSKSRWRPVLAGKAWHPVVCC